eukprot:m.48205 g.48205  ORF g.48205 m.48205 type:complete len:1423 (-) comp12387_c0_seq3:88-4356(-)
MSKRQERLRTAMTEGSDGSDVDPSCPLPSSSLDLTTHPFDRPWIWQLFSLATFSWVWPIIKEGQKRIIDEKDFFPLPSDEHAESCTGAVYTRLLDFTHPDNNESTTTTATVRGRAFNTAANHAPATNSSVEKTTTGVQGPDGDIKDQAQSTDQPSVMRAESKINRSPHALLYTLLTAHPRIYMWVGIAYFIEALLRILQAYLLGLVVQSIDQADSIPTQRAYLYAGLLALANFCQGVLHHISFYSGSRIAQMLRTGMIGLIHAKAVSISSSNQAKVTTGHIINLVSNDVERIMMSIPFLHYLWISLVQLVVVTVLAWQEVGVYAISGIVFYLFYIPLHMYLSRRFAILRRETAELTDQRVKVTNEVLCGMRIIKMYAWEYPFHAAIQRVRQAEVTRVIASGVMKGLNLATFYCATAIAGYFCFMPMVVENKPLNAHTVFYTLALLEALRFVVGLKVPMSSQGLSEVIVAMHRIQAFLDIPDFHGISVASTRDSSPSSLDALTPTPSKPPPPESNDAAPGRVMLQQATVCWEQRARPSLSNVSLTVEPGEFIGVCGPVGCGKTTLLMALLREVPLARGHMSLTGNLSFASQTPWIQNATVKENILMADNFGEARYNAVVHACALRQDLLLLPAGDDTEVGERGVTLSGGQKARVSLARAVYRQADIYLLDDPLSAVDTEVGRHLFTECFQNLLKNKTRILVTHQVQHLQAVDKVVVLSREGQILAVGPYAYVTKQHPEIFKHLAEQMEHPSNDNNDGPLENDILLEENRANPVVGDQQTEHPSLDKNPSVEMPANAHGKLVQAETRQEGAVTTSTYKTYLLAMGSAGTLFLLLMIQLLPQVAMIGVDVFLATWVKMDPSRQKDEKNFITYTLLVAVTVAFAILRGNVTIRAIVRASRRLHENMLSAILAAPIRFFDTQPSGRILNRFSKDLGYMDDLLPVTILDFNQLAIGMLGAVILACTVNPWVLLCIPPLLLLLLWLRRVYLASAREVKRIEAIERSPVYSHFSATLAGAIILRSHGMTQYAIQQMHMLQDNHSTAFHMFLVLSRWIGFRLDFLTFLLMTVTVFAAVASRNSIDAGLVGASLIYMLRLTGNFQWCVRQSAEIENHMTSVERVVEYSQLDPEEKQSPLSSEQHSSKSQQPLSKSLTGDSWPELGSITFHQVNMRYDRHLPDVLHNISFTIMAGEKIGIVGRTGAGKSSILSALFRLSTVSGSILIDGVDTATLPLHTLRERIGVIPQDPVLFSGTMRYNLDPFGQYTDDALWKALEKVELKYKVSDMPEGLSTLLYEHGSNFSVGERQLVCLARAILRENKILVLDEATANVDYHTDHLIQQTIRTAFVHCTVLTIAHRLNTIMDSDRVMVLSAGRVVEFDHAHRLLSESDSELSRFVLQTSPTNATYLKRIAEQSYPTSITRRCSNPSIV